MAHAKLAADSTDEPPDFSGLTVRPGTTFEPLDYAATEAQVPLPPEQEHPITGSKGWVSLKNPEVARRYIEVLSQTGRYTGAAAAAGVSRGQASDFRIKYPEFQALCDEALERFKASLEAEGYRRAVHGIAEPVYHQGVQVGVTYKKSDKLLELFLKTKIPEFREASGGSRTTVNVSATATATAAAAQATGPMAALAGIDPSKLPKASRELYRALLASLPQQPGLPSPDASALPQGEGQDLSLPMLDVASHELHEATESPPVAGNAAGDPMPRGIFQARGEDSSDSDE